MIELDDPVTKLDVGMVEYVVMNTLEVTTIRHLLLLDVDRVMSLKVFGRAVGERMMIWQKLLRKYLTYEKLREARSKEAVPMEDPIVHEPLSKAGFEKDDIELLKKYDITTILEFLDCDIDAVFPEEDTPEDIRERVVAHRDRLCNKELLEESIEESMLIEFTGARTTRYEEPEKTVTAAEFLDVSVAETGINPNETEALEAIGVITVTDFLNCNVERIKELKGYSVSVYTRLHAWQKFMRKRLHWKK